MPKQTIKLNTAYKYIGSDYKGVLTATPLAKRGDYYYCTCQVKSNQDIIHEQKLSIYDWELAELNK